MTTLWKCCFHRRFEYLFVVVVVVVADLVVASVVVVASVAGSIGNH